MSRPSLVVERPGLCSTLQDLGRFGYQRFGISASGAMDGVSLRVANVLAGNAPEAAALELTLTGLAATVQDAPCRVALAGADMPVSVNGSRLDGWRSIALEPGDRIEIGSSRSGLYAYLAVAGGFDVAPTLGSLSTHTRTALGGFAGRALAEGDRLPLVGAPARPDTCLPGPSRASWGGPVRVVLGPQDDFFTAEGIATFLGSDYAVTGRTDRMGMHLDGPPLEHAQGFNIVSDGIMNGSVQVPGTGKPLILLADRQTTGGYPKIATVIGPDLPLVAQRRPGETIRFVAVSPEEAEQAAHAHRRALAAMLEQIVPLATHAAAPGSEALLAANLVSGVWSAWD
ncbi:MAG: biotin-dependent carboxyltransferase family protein [Alsobacter sp.]